jgi:hypothetical protein
MSQFTNHQLPREPPQESTQKPASTNGDLKPCIFHAKGRCRHGNECRFSHDIQKVSTLSTASGDNTATPIPFTINIPPGCSVFSIDVECVATGVQHNARSVAQVALVNEWGQPIFNTYIKQDLPVLSYIHELTGLSSEILDRFGLPLGD